MPRPCSLWLDIFDDDRETIAWSVTTDPVSTDYDEEYADPLPYLIDPMRYGEQSLDVAKGSASIGTVTVGVIDPARIANDKDSGWMTMKLSKVFGRRCRLRRYVDDVTSYVVIADGPADEPRLEPDFASYTWAIRDTRESERKIRAFVDLDPTTSAWPAGVREAFGMIPAVAPNVGTIMAGANVPVIAFDAYWVSSPPALDGSTVVDPAAVVSSDVEAAFLPTITVPFTGLWVYTYDKLTILKRVTGSMDPWTVSRAPFTASTFQRPPEDAVLFTVRAGQLADGTPVRAIWRSPDSALTTPFWSGAPLDEFDVMLLLNGPPSKASPYHVDGLTAGEFAKNLYDGVYSPRGPLDALVPSGTRYDEAALLAMDTPLTLRLFEPITDGRDWLEKYLYSPQGMAPALDDQLLVSPVSQVGPEDDYDLPVINAAITEPGSSWGGGKRVVNILRFTYPRDYLPHGSIKATTTGDGLLERPIVLEFRDEVSIARHGDQLLEIDGRAFRAIGDDVGSAVDGDETAEVGYQLAQLRNTHVKGRYVKGAPNFPVTVMRSGTQGIRAGSFVAMDIPWLPDPYITGRRGLTGIAQVMGIAELDCAWREMSIEMLPGIEPAEPGEEIPDPVAPAAIDDLDALALSHSRILLTWSLPATATGVKIHRDTSPAFTPGGGNLIDTVGAVETYEDTGLTPATPYYYQAIAFNGVGDAPASNEATDTTDAQIIPAPSIVASAYDDIAEEYTIEITPHDDSPAGVTWHVEHSTDEGENYSSAESDTALTIVHAHIMSGAQSCWVYVYGTLAGWTDSDGSNVEVVPAEVT